MSTSISKISAAVSVLASLQSGVLAQGVTLHVNPRWKNCSFQLDPSLTQDAWHQFTQEAALVVYYRPLTDAQPMGAGNFEVSVLRWDTKIDETDAAWNDTFVHPDSTHWLTAGDPLMIPGLTARAGITRRLDVAAYWTKSSGANYGFWGGQVQYNVANDPVKHWAASTRLSFVSMYGPEDLNMNVYGLDLLASRQYAVFSDWTFISPYAGVSTYLSSSHEKSAAVSLKDENVLGVQGMIGAVAQIALARLAVEYNLATVNTLSFKVGVSF